MFVVKVKSKDTTTPSYCNKNIILPVNEIDQNRNWLGRLDFTMSFKEAKELYKVMLFRALDSKAYEYISIVELSNYEPYSEYQVIEYREFK